MRNVVRGVAVSGQEAIIADSGTEVAVVISMEDYERLHEHADAADALLLWDKRATDFRTLSMAEMLEMLDVSDAPRDMDT